MYEEKEPVKKVKKEKKSNKFFHDIKLKEKVDKVKEKTKKREKKIPKKLKEKEITPKIDKTENSGKTKVIRFKPDFVSILIKFGIFLFIAFIIIFAVTKIRLGSDRKSFADNIEKMKEVSYTYFKAEKNRPSLVLDEVDITLDDMVKGSLIKELKDKKGNVCSRDYSYVSMTKKSSEDYEMTVYLSCAGEAQTATYNITYPSDNNDDQKDNKTTYYELQRIVTNDETYSCPDGYILKGTYCEKATETIAATPVYKVTPEKNTKASYKSSRSEYEYTDPIITIKENVLKCSNGYTLENGKCIKETSVKYKTRYTYSCPDGGTPSNNRCLFTTNTDYKDTKAYCSKGRLINEDECYVTKDYSFKCLTGKKDSTKHSCYTTYAAKTTLSDWLFDSKVKYSESTNIDRFENEKVHYEYDYYDERNNKNVYKKYVRKNIKVCDDDDILSGSTCKHYDDSYISKYCTGDYELTSDSKECYTIKEANYKNIKGSYTCPIGYHKTGTRENAHCSKYEKATKTGNQTAYCSYGYELTKDNRCLKVESAILVDEENAYSCPEGYLQKKNGKATKCYKKTTTEAYYYCTNSKATLNGDRCIVPSVTKVISLRCPSGYKKSGNQCVKSSNSKDRIKATKKEATSTTEKIWSKEKEMDGWTWTGNTKEE